MLGTRNGSGVRVVCTILLLVVGLAARATEPQMVEPGYCLEHTYEPSLVVPNHIAVSPSGIIVTTEWSEGRRVVRVHEDGSLSTYAQPSSGHHFGVIFDAANNLYVGDGPNNLWRVSPEGEIALVAEDVYGFNLDIGPSGDIYAVGGSDACVQRITPEGDVSTYAEGFVGASELAVCPLNEDVFVFDLLAGTIWRAVPGGAPDPLATGLIHEVSSIAVSPDGVLYLSSMGHLYTVSRVDGALTEPEWVVELAGNLHPGEMDFDSSGRLVLTGHMCIARLDLEAETAEVLWKGYGHSEALDVAPGGGGIYVGDSSPFLTTPGSVVKIESDGSATPFVDGLLAEVCGFVVKTVDLGYVVSSQFAEGGWTCIVHEVDMVTGAKTEYATTATHGRRLAIDPVAGRLWGLFDGISYFDEAGGRHVLDHASTGIIQVESIAFTPDGTLYITGYTTDIMGMPVAGALYRIDDQYGVAPSFVSVADLSTVSMCCPLGTITGGTDGNIYWVGHGDRYTPGNERDMHMLRITPAGVVSLIGHRFPMDPFAVATDPDSGDLYFTSGNGIYRVYQMPLTPVYFPDAGLESAVRDAIGKPAGDIFDWDLIGLSVLDAGDRAIADLEGVEQCTDLSELNLGNNDICDIDALADLTELEQLWLDNNQINDITPLTGLTDMELLSLGGNLLTEIAALAGLTGLKELCLWYNQLSDVSALSGLVGLERLWLDHNLLSDIAALGGLDNLVWLFLGDNGIESIAPLSGLTNLVELELYGNQISDIGPLAGLAELTTLSLNGNAIAGVGALSGLTALTELSMADNQISDIGPLAGLTGLTSLSLDGNAIAELGDLSGLTALTWLSLGGNEITSIDSLSALSALQSLTLFGNQISDIGPLAGLTNLSALGLNDNPIGSIDPLSGLVQLEALWLDGLQLNDVSPLSSLVSLRELYLNFNRVVDLTPIAGLTSLTTLELHSNRIRDTAPLQGLTSLGGLDLRENRISDIGPLVANAGIGNGDCVDVRWNWLNLTPGSADMADIDALLGRGVETLYDPQHEAPDTSAAFRVEAEGTVLCDETFYAATFQTGAADVAEWVAVTTWVGPGTVLELDPNRPGAYRICLTECSSLLAGVVSSEPGVILSDAVELGSKALLALAGIVPVKVTNEGGPIHPGDLLVSAVTPGHAMRCRSQTACPCCILGKALAPMLDASGVILVLLMTP